MTEKDLLIQELRRKLKEYEDTGMMPEAVNACKLYAMGKAFAEITEFDGIPIERLRELAQSEKDGRLVILPCRADPRVILRHADGHDYHADHWNIYLTACRDADTPAGYTSRLLSIEEVRTAMKRAAVKGESHA